MKEADLDERLRVETAAAGKKQLAAVLAVHLPRRLCDALLAAGRAAGRPQGGRPEPAGSRATGRLRSSGCRCRSTGTLGFGKAEVTAGGVALDEVDSRTMQSKLVPGLYIAGEVLDLDGPIGGYNFQAAWSTGWLAGSAAAEAV